MNINKKFGLIFLVLVVLPIIIFIFRDSFVDLGSQGNNQLNNILLSISIVGCAIILYKNKKLENTKKIWYIIPTILVIVFLFILYVGNSISHIGF
jgi:hypothetical protein